ncbi:MAG: PASTA domain-containing protein, partial [Solirubrobacteraceae bacterium]|nr:PASTA domain-containing protein [Solirubrobacteraceae bacterium]
DQHREPAAEPPRPSRRRKRWPWLLLGGLALCGLILGLVSILTPERAPVPNVVGASISVATQRLQSDGFEVQAVRDTSDRPRNEVIGQDPGGGTVADKGSRVTITVSEGPAITEVPDVVGARRNAARMALTDAGFEVEETRTASDSVAVNRVISQSPDGGSIAETGRAVRIEVSTGPERLRVPDVTGESIDDAREALEGFRVSVSEREDDDADPGTVLSQSPPGGTLPRGATVRLTVATEPTQAEVPDVVGRSQNTATTTLSGAGFEVAVEEVDVDSATQDGRVQRQSPAGGRDVDRGATVTITVGVFERPPSPPPPPPPPPAQPPPAPPPTTTTPAP